jgi:hypothetical protein
MMPRWPIRVTLRQAESGRFFMLGRILAVTLSVGTAMTSSAALAQNDAAVAAGVITGLAVGAAVASGGLAVEHREPLRTYIYAEPRPSYVYSDEVVVGRTLAPGDYQSYPVPERYGVVGHHYTIINNRAVVYHPETRRIIHVYD